MRFANSFLIAAALLAAATVRAQGPTLEYHGAGWVGMGRVMGSTVFVGEEGNAYKGNWMQNAGGKISISSKIDEHWSAAFGLGTVQVALARGSWSNATLWYPFWVPFVSEANISFESPLFTGEDKLGITLGAFSYGYNPDSKDLGQYLLSGYTYPANPVTPNNNVLGGKLGYGIGMLQNDLIVKVEEDKPAYDVSLADVVTLKLLPGVELGAGVNLYRLYQAEKRLTSPRIGECDGNIDMSPYSGVGKRNPCFIEEIVHTVPADTNSPLDTILHEGSYSGTKLMGRIHLDPKAWFGMDGDGSMWGRSDFVLYAEAGVFGTKNYPVYYEKIAERIPVMVGFNIPTLGLLDNLTIEAEYYKNKQFTDNIAAQNGSWIPPLTPIFDPTSDDLKWAVSASRVFDGHFKLALLFASDHLRLGGSHNTSSGVESVSATQDWYWTGSFAYFF